LVKVIYTAIKQIYERYKNNFDQFVVFSLIALISDVYLIPKPN